MHVSLFVNTMYMYVLVYFRSEKSANLDDSIENAKVSYHQSNLIGACAACALNANIFFTNHINSPTTVNRVYFA